MKHDEEHYDGKLEHRCKHEENGRLIVIHDVPYITDENGDKLTDVDDEIEQYEKGNWDYIEKEESE